MRIWADVYTPTGDRLGAGAITTVQQASVTRALDGAGDFSFTVPATDARVQDLLTNKRRVRLFTHQEGVGTRELVRGIIEKRSSSDAASGFKLSINGPDILEELKFSSVLLGRKYDNVTVQVVVDDLLGLTTGWSRSGAATNNISARYDGANVLKVLQTLVAQQGLHFRMTAPNVVEIGTFGVSNGLRIINAIGVSRDLYDNQSVLLVEKFQLTEDSEDIVNWLLPIGAGRGDAALTLEKSTRTAPYTIQSMTGPDGRTLYYISDATSITTYGQIEKVGTFKDITPIATSEEAQVQAANALYDASVAWLNRYKDKFDSYSVTCRKIPANIYPGDKIHVRYKGVITDKYGETVDYRDINDDFWIMDVKESLGTSGNTLTLKIASIDRYEQDAANVILGALEEIRINNVQVEPTFNGRGYVYSRDIDSTHTATIPIDITNATQSLISCQVRIKSQPFRSNVTGAASGGGSTATSAGGGGTTQSSTTTGLSTGLMIPVGGDHRHDIVAHGHNVTIPSHTHDVTIPSHSHGVTYGIFDDTAYPNTISLSINGVDYTTELGGTWGNGGVAVDTVIEIADYINLSILQQLHTLTFSCSSGRGQIEVTVALWEIIQTVSAQ